MKFKRFNQQELDAYKRGKIAGYYSWKAHERRMSNRKSSAPSSIKYSEHSAADALERALQRSYQNK